MVLQGWELARNLTGWANTVLGCSWGSTFASEKAYEAFQAAKYNKIGASSRFHTL